jgi:hypothetical protein
VKRVHAFAEGLGTGAFVFSLAAAAAVLWKPDAVTSWLSRETGAARARRLCERAERAAKTCPQYLDACRAAGL